MMKPSDHDVDPELLPSRDPFPVEPFMVALMAVLSILGLTGYLVASHELLPTPLSASTLFGMAIAVYGVGLGGFVATVNLLINPAVTYLRAGKGLIPYGVALLLIAPLVGVGAFEPLLAIVFFTFLASFGLIYAVCSHLM